jgi:hypothetical protein
MSVTATPSPDGRYVDVFVPIQFKRIGGRKMIVAPDGSRVVPETNEDADSTITKALGRASRWQKLLEDGVHATITDLAKAERINRSYVSRMLRLCLLAPDIVDALLDGSQPPTLRLADIEAPFPIEWGQQRRQFGFTVIDSKRTSDYLPPIANAVVR